MWSSVELREIRVFLVLAEELHFARAAERMMITPSRVSQTLRTLEGRVGGRLLERSSRHVSLTPLGTRLYASMRPAYQQMQDAFERARETTGGVSGRIRLGLYSSVSGGPHFTEILTEFHRQFPNCQVELVDTGWTDPLPALRRGDVEVTATRLPVGDDLVVRAILSREERVALMSRHDPLAARESIGYDDLAGHTLNDITAMGQPLADAFCPPRTPSGHVLRRRSYSSPETLVHVALGDVVHMSVPAFLRYYQHPDVVAVPVRDLPPSETALVTRPDLCSLAVDALSDVAEKVMAARA